MQNTHKWEIPAKDPSSGLFNKQLKTDNQVVFNGAGTTTRDGTLILNITVHIEDILPNGNLILRGRKQIQINDEISEIILSGIARRDDIMTDNTINSTRIANMQIDVKGTGPVSALFLPLLCRFQIRQKQQIWLHLNQLNLILL